MLPSLEIRDFRTFRHLRIERLGRVNLIVGKNNVGKTALLEALWLYALRGSPGQIRILLESRDEISRETMDIGATRWRTTFGEDRVRLAYEHLFHGRKALREVPVPIRIGLADAEDNALTIAVKWFVEHEDETGRHRRILPPGKESEYADAQLALISQFGALPPFILAIEEPILTLPAGGLALRKTGWVQPEALSEIEIRAIFLPATGLSALQVERLWDSVALTGLEDDVLSFLRVIAPEVERISLVSSPLDPAQRVFLARLSGIARPVPLRSIGEGLNRLLCIVLALVNTRDGMLLVDEFENGLHYSVQPEIWRLIFRAAHRLNIQVFATSHSWDTIEAFQIAAQENEEVEGELIRLDRKHGELRAVVADERLLGIATRDQIEVR